MNCHKCKHHGTIPGDAHLKCNLLKDTKSYPLFLLTAHIRSKYPFKDIGLRSTDKKTGEEINPIELDEIGLRGGWAVWPINFDPRWVTKCIFYEET